MDDFIEFDGLIAGVPNTFMVWIKYTPGLGRGCLLANYPDAKNINWEIFTDGKPRVYWNNGAYPSNTGPAMIDRTVPSRDHPVALSSSGELDYKFSDDVRTGTWEHLAFVRDTAAGTYTYYHDAVLKETKTSIGSSTLPVTTHLIGKDKRTTANPPIFGGEMAMLRVFSAAISGIGTQMASSCCNAGSDILVSMQFNNNEVENCAGGPGASKTGGSQAEAFRVSLAAGKVATSSSTNSGTASLVNDGEMHVCTDPKSLITDGNPVEWWQVDLAASQTNGVIVDLYHETDCCGASQTIGAQVFISTSSQYSTGTVCGTLTADGMRYTTQNTAYPGMPPETVLCNAEGRYVTVVGDGSQLRLCEVEVFPLGTGPSAATCSVGNLFLHYCPIALCH